MKNFEEFLSEAEDSIDFQELNEDYASQAATNQSRMQRTTERMQLAKDKINQLNAISQGYKDRAAKSNDDIAKASYDARIATNEARKNAYSAYIQYLQSMVMYYQAKSKEISTKQKAAERRKL